MKIRRLRQLHRYLGFVIGIQLLVWAASGLFFSLNPIEKVRGTTEAAEKSVLDLPTEALASPTEVLAELENSHPGLVVHSVTLAPLLDTLVYRVQTEDQTYLADAATGTLLPPLDRAQAEAVAREDFLPEAPVAAVQLIETEPPGSEYRGSPLPVWRVTFDHPLGTRIYVSADSGEVVKRRNTRWRLFDLMWMLHIMDFGNRDDINNAVLQIAAAFGMVTVLSGFLLGFRTSFPRTRKQKETGSHLRNGPTSA